jgi:hypothetical protein
MWATGITLPLFRREVILMSNGTLMLLFQAGLFLLSLLTLKVVSFPIVKDVSSTN